LTSEDEFGAQLLCNAHYTRVNQQMTMSLSRYIQIRPAEQLTFRLVPADDVTATF